MKTLAIATIALIPTFCWAATFPVDAAKQKCSTEWPSDFQMQAYCLKQQKTGFEQVDQQRGGLSAPLKASLQNCEAEWATDYQMQAYCLEKQVAAKRNLDNSALNVPSDVAETIMGGCNSEWSGDFVMIEYCAKKQVQGWKQLNE